MNINLLAETHKTLAEIRKTPTDIKWVGSYDGEYQISWEEFEKLADFEYYNDFGGQVIAADLVIVGDSWWLERGEYDGSEWWEYKKRPMIKSNPVAIGALKGSMGWMSVAQIANEIAGNDVSGQAR